MVLIYFKKARIAKTWILHLNPEDGRSRHPDSILPAFGWKERSADGFTPLMPVAMTGKPNVVPAQSPAAPDALLQGTYHRGNVRPVCYRENLNPLPTTRPQAIKPHSVTNLVTSKLS